MLSLKVWLGQKHTRALCTHSSLDRSSIYGQTSKRQMFGKVTSQVKRTDSEILFSTLLLNQSSKTLYRQNKSKICSTYDKLIYVLVIIIFPSHVEYLFLFGVWKIRSGKRWPESYSVVCPFQTILNSSIILALGSVCTI